jgi:hypothetical protein
VRAQDAFSIWGIFSIFTERVKLKRVLVRKAIIIFLNVDQFRHLDVRVKKTGDARE